MTKLILPAGITQTHDLDNAGVAAVRQLRLGTAKYLSDLFGEYVFYTSALLHLHFPTAPDLWAAYVASRGSAAEPIQFSVQFDKQLFRGLEVGLDTAWNHVLFAVDVEVWPSLAKFLEGATFWDPATRKMRQIKLQRIAVPDPLRSSPQPMCPVYAICLEGHDNSIQFGHTPSHLCPTVVTQPNQNDSLRRLEEAFQSSHVDLQDWMGGEPDLTNYPKDPVTVTPEVSIETLPIAKQKELQEALAQARVAGVVQ